MTFNRNDPRYQRDIQRAYAKADTTENRPITSGITAAHTKYQLGRRLQFDRLGMEDKASKARFSFAKNRLRTRGKFLGLQEDQIKDEAHNLDWTIGLGLGTLGFAALEGRRRSNAIKADLAERESFFNYLRKDLKERQDYRKWLEYRKKTDAALDLKRDY